MTRKMTRKWMAVMGVGFLSFQVSAEETLVLQSQKEKASYRFWADMGRNLKRQAIDLDVDVLVRGLGDGLSGETLLVGEQDLRVGMAAFQAKVKRKQAGARVPAEGNKK